MENRHVDPARAIVEHFSVIERGSNGRCGPGLTEKGTQPARQAADSNDVTRRSTRQTPDALWRGPAEVLKRAGLGGRPLILAVPGLLGRYG
ncbi:MAG TPA: hypothetical protein VNF73_11930 [Candidatus Saccharimonadales bacterium]|nr:hypothetical protein [Candidatus Saccharimonadales bacterium]